MKIIIEDLDNLKCKGIYCIKNLVNNKVYIGSTLFNFKKRFQEHKRRLIGKCHHSIYLSRSVEKHGIENFQFEILEIIEDSSIIRSKESEYIDVYESISTKKGYNISNVTNQPPLDVLTKKKISNSLKEKYKNDLVFKGQMTELTNKKRGKPSWNKGIICKNISDARKNLFDDIEVYDQNMCFFRKFDNAVEIEAFSKSVLNDLPLINNKRKNSLVKTIMSQNIHRAIRTNTFYKGLFFKKVPRNRDIT